MEKGYDAFFHRLCEACYSSIHHIKGGLTLSTSIYSMQGQLLGRADDIASIDEVDWDRG